MTAVSQSEYNPRNTDGFDIGEASYVTLENIKVVNQDDCVAFKPGCDYVTVRNIECNCSHGLSVGSLAKYPGSVDTVTNILVQGATMRNSSKAIGIKISRWTQLQHGSSAQHDVGGHLYRELRYCVPV
ncbi:pectin lyase fold/virulence factor [Aspergillus granulosus]|uniref:Pectin lyase fold/virulence factor n=1 Tax=Aspergillus granulosus TaxID=176169 RepID=A0ABR4H9F4_9EURO